MAVVVQEQYGTSLLKRDYKKTPEGQVLQLDRSPNHSSIAQFFRSVFLPQGYPDSVSKDYAEYQIWDTVQAFASSISNALATHSLLHGMGVGDETASVLAATMTWILKDGTGMTGRILFAWMKGNQLDCDAKSWRLFADFLNDFAICLEIVAPLTHTYFRWVVCFAGVCKSLVGVAGGATRAALTQHQARRNNMADVSAKDGSQETLVNLAALVCSMGMLPLVSGHYTLIGILFVLMTGLHLFANYKAVKAVCMESLNQARLHLIMEQYFKTGEVPDVGSINAQEPLFWSVRSGWQISLGASFSAIDSNLDSLKEAYNGLNSKYLLDFDAGKKKVTIVLSPQAMMSDQLQACIQAELIIFVIRHTGQALSSGLSEWISSHWHFDNHAEILNQSYVQAKKLLPSLLPSMVAQNWRTDLCLLSADEWRATWDFENLPRSKDD